MENGTKSTMIKQSSKKELSIPKIISNRWQVLEKIGHGGFGDIYRAYDSETNDYVAVKMEKRAESKNLHSESEYYKLITDYARSRRIEKRIPNFLWYGREKNINAAVFDLMGESLSVLFRKCKKKFSLKTILMIADQMLDCIHFIHECGIVHRDIKPGNFVIGRNDKRIYIIDFGLSNFWRDRNGNHIMCKTNCAFKGTYRYASRNSHFKFEQSRRDDLESLGYILIYFMKGKLPWQNLKVSKSDRKKVIGRQKDMISLEKLTEGLPEEILRYMKYVRKLSFDETPDYLWIKSLFNECFFRYGFTYDNMYDWDNLTEERVIKNPPMKCFGDEFKLGPHQTDLDPEPLNCDTIFHNVTPNIQPQVFELNSSAIITHSTRYDQEFPSDHNVHSPVDSPYTTQTTLVDEDEVCLLGESYYVWENYEGVFDALNESIDFDEKDIVRTKRSYPCHSDGYPIAKKIRISPYLLKAND